MPDIFNIPNIPNPFRGTYVHAGVSAAVAACFLLGFGFAAADAVLKRQEIDRLSAENQNLAARLLDACSPAASAGPPNLEEFCDVPDIDGNVALPCKR